MGLANRDYMRDPSRSLFAVRRTPVTWWIVALNVVLWIFAAGTARSGEPFARFVYQDLVLNPELVWQGQVWRLFTSLWVHGVGFSHVLFNMLILIVLGRSVEERIGSRRYLLLYLAAGLAASLAFALFWLATKNPVVTFGATGAVFGVATWLATREPNRSIHMFVIAVPLWVLVGIFMIGGALVGLGDRQRAMEPLVSHLVGALVGFAFAKYGNPFAAFAPKSTKHAPTSPKATKGSARAAASPSPERKPTADAATRARVDTLLTKISDEGMASLSAEEKQFLEQASQRFR